MSRDPYDITEARIVQMDGARRFAAEIANVHHRDRLGCMRFDRDAGRQPIDEIRAELHRLARERRQRQAGAS